MSPLWKEEETLACEVKKQGFFAECLGTGNW